MMLNLKSLVGLGLMLSWSPLTFSDNLSLDCHPHSTMKNGNLIVLNYKEPANTTNLYFIRNNGSQNVTIDHHKKNPGAGAGWASTLSPNKWSVLVVSQNNFTIQCDPSSQTTQTARACLLKVCVSQYPLRSSVTGNYWLIENATWANLFESLKEKGVSPTQHPS